MFCTGGSREKVGWARNFVFLFVWPVARREPPRQVAPPLRPCLPPAPPAARAPPRQRSTPRAPDTPGAPTRFSASRPDQVPAPARRATRPAPRRQLPPSAPLSRATLPASRAHRAPTQRTRRTHPFLSIPARAGASARAQSDSPSVRRQPFRHPPSESSHHLPVETTARETPLAKVPHPSSSELLTGRPRHPCPPHTAGCSCVGAAAATLCALCLRATWLLNSVRLPGRVRRVAVATLTLGSLGHTPAHRHSGR